MVLSSHPGALSALRQSSPTPAKRMALPAQRAVRPMASGGASLVKPLLAPRPMPSAAPSAIPAVMPSAPGQAALSPRQFTGWAASPWRRDVRERQEVAIPKLAHQLYAHGAYMGLAKSLLTDPIARAVLARLMPAVSAQAQTLLAAGQLSAVMLLLENNPVLAAYGASRRRQPLPMEWDIWLDPAHPEDMDKARIIHGNLVATLLSAGQDVRTAPKLLTDSVHGSNAHLGISPRAWLADYAEAAKALGLGARRPCALYLDIKSGWSTAADVQRFVDEVRRQGLTVRGVGSFTASQLQGLQVNHPLLYVHGVAGVSLALRAGSLAEGGRALLNGGALLQHTGSGWQVAPAALRELRQLQEAGKLQLGVYVQENLACAEALTVLTDLINREPKLFKLGFAYGNLPGVAEGGLRGGAGLGWQRVSLAGDAVRRMWLPPAYAA